MKVKFMATSAIIAALYIVVTLIFSAVSFGQLGFRIAEIFNHLVAFNPRYFIGVVLRCTHLKRTIFNNRCDGYYFWCRSFDYYARFTYFDL